MDAEAQFMKTESPLKLNASDRLLILRRLDHLRKWSSLNDKRFCVCCRKVITGRQIEAVGATRPFGPLRLLCPTENCVSTCEEWVYVRGAANTITQETNSGDPSIDVRVRRYPVPVANTSNNLALGVPEKAAG